MKWSLTLLPLFFALLLNTSATAQLFCEYTLVMEDDFGDGWNGGVLTIAINGNATTYTLDFANPTFQEVSIPIQEGSEIVLSYVAGSFPWEVSYALFDADGILVFQDGQGGIAPQQGTVFTGTASCPSCPAVPVGSVGVDRLRAYTADISWLPSDPLGQYAIEYGLSGFDLGEGLLRVVNGATTRLTNLEEKTTYDFYITAYCSNGDTSVTIGPYSFETLFAVDVGVTAILSPISGCGLSAFETIALSITNFGGLPQSLIPFNFSLNGNPGAVNQPIDGFFTGVIGTDSTRTTEFDARIDLSEPGEYNLLVWTEIEGDSVLTNDTTSLLIVSIPFIEEFPYFDGFEAWSGGWTVEQAGNGLASWAHGVPTGNVISAAASGANAWVTNLSGPYNNSERSYLISPCLDFSSFDEDPRIAFQLNFESEDCCDRGWVEVSTDDGATWTKVGQTGTGLNWYNDAINNWWRGTGGFTGWNYAQNVLTGTAGFSDVRIRFVFTSDGSVVREGMGIDNFLISRLLAADLAAASARNTSTEECGSAEDEVVMLIANVGSTAQTGFEVGYSVNGSPAVIENVGSLTIAPNTTGSYTFSQTFDSSIPGRYEIKVWAQLEGDDFPANDTTTIIYETAVSPPFSEDFEAGVIPANFTVGTGVAVTNGHNNTSFVIHSNLWSSNQNMTLSSPVIGPIGADDTLSFDYRFVDYFAGTIPTILTLGDTLEVRISLDCGATFFPIHVINGSNHTPMVSMQNVELPLGDYEGLFIKVGFRGRWGVGDYWLDIDNINIRSCPPSLELQAEVRNVSAQDVQDGAITVSAAAGSAPYTFQWSNGATGSTIEGLAPGTYKVTVTDRFGCRDALDVEVTIVSSTAEWSNISDLKLAPNPTRGTATLSLALRQPADVRIQVLNAMGQLLQDQPIRHLGAGDFELDFRSYSNGLYLVRILAEGEVKTLKLIKTDR
jgi:hypothetical protein